MRHSAYFAITAALLVGCSSSTSGTGSSSTPEHDSGTKPNSSGSGTMTATNSSGRSNSTASKADAGETDGGNSGSHSSTSGGSSTGTSDGGSHSSTSDGGSPSGTCGTATLFAGNPVYGESDHDPNTSDSPSQRPQDGAAILGATPYLYQKLWFTSGGPILTNDQLSVWQIGTDNKLHAIVQPNLLADSGLTHGACSTATFARLEGSALGSDGTLYVADWQTNAILAVKNPLTAATCEVAFLAGTNEDLTSSDIGSDDGAASGNGYKGAAAAFGADGTGANATFYGPQTLTIDSSNNIYALDNGTAWAVRKITTTGVVTTIATFADGTYPYAFLQALGGKVYFWGANGSTSTADLIALDPTVTTPVNNPPATFSVTSDNVGADSTAEWDIGGITTDGTKLYVIADGQIFSITVSGTSSISMSLAGQNDDTWNAQSQPDFDWQDNYDPTASIAASKLEILMLPSAVSSDQIGGIQLSIDSSKNLYITDESEDKYVEKIAGCP